MNSSKDDKSGGINPKDSFDLLYLLASVHSICITPFLRVGYGSEGIGIRGLIGLFYIVTIGAFKNSSGMLIYMFAWLGMLVFQRCITGWKFFNGKRTHSQYDGYPWVAAKLMRVSNERVARQLVEPGLCLLVGFILSQISDVVGGFVLMGAGAIFIKSMIDYAADDARVRKMRDAHIEQHYYSERFRDSNR